MDQIKNFIDLVAQGNNIEAKEAIDSLLSTRAFEQLETKKQEIASTLFGATETQE